MAEKDKSRVIPWMSTPTFLHGFGEPVRLLLPHALCINSCGVLQTG